MPDVFSPQTAQPRRPPSLVGFFVAAFLVSALGFFPMVLASWRGAAAVPGPVKLLQLLMLFGPALLAITWAAREGGKRGVRALLGGLLRWRVHPGWYAAVLLGPLAIYFLSRLIGRAAGATIPDVSPDKLLAAFGPAFLAYLFLNTEELAWRGYAWPRLAAKLGKLRGALVLGTIWAVLHFPLFLMRGGHPGGYPPLLFGAMVIVFGVIFALVYDLTGGSILLVHLLHQSVNAWGDALPVYPRVTGSFTPVIVMIVLGTLLTAIGVWRAGWLYLSFTRRDASAGQQSTA